MTRDRTPARPRTSLLHSWRLPLVTVASMTGVVAAVALVDPTPGALILGAVLAMTLARNRLASTWRGRAEAIILLPLVALATTAVGYLLKFAPLAGAAAFVAAVFLSIWPRRFGPTWHRIGTLVALPFITLLIAPGGGRATTPIGAALLSLVALVIVVAVRLLAELVRLLPREVSAAQRITGRLITGRPGTRTPSTTRPSTTRPSTGRPSTRRPSTMRPQPSTRMAIQMAIAVGAAFPVGWLVFPQHFTWVVLTAFLVCSGNRGRADVLHKGGLRILGAAAGSVVATGLLAIEPSPGHPLVAGAAFVVLLLAIIGIGLWLRTLTYAAWALAVTLALSLLQGVIVPSAATGAAQLWIRVLAIVCGAVCGLAASWFILPIRSGDVMRSRIAAVLAALSAFVDNRDSDGAAELDPASAGELDADPATAAELDSAPDAELDAAMARLHEVAAPWNAIERILREKTTTRRPGRWVWLVGESVRLVRAGAPMDQSARRALAAARRSMRDPAAIGPALAALRDEVTGG